VVAAFPSAVYADFGGEVVALVTADGLRLPGSLVVAARSGSAPFAGVRPGHAATVGAGRLRAGPLTLVVRRWWRPLAPRRVAIAECSPALDVIAALLPPLATPLPEDPLAVSPVELLGLGPGLTPAGDDVLAGMLVTLHALLPESHPMRGELQDTVDAASSRTTALSATLLRHAALGHGIPPLVRLVDAVTGATGRDPSSAVQDMLVVGHSSGVALAHGVVAAARLATFPSPLRRGLAFPSIEEAPEVA
jgi:hypothetical protein